MSLKLKALKLKGPVWLMQPIPYFGEDFKGEWIVEPKIDGWRMQIIRYSSGKIEFWGRRLEKKPDWTEKLSHLTEVAEKIFPPGTLFDTELYSTGGRQFIPSLFVKNPKKKNPKILPLIFIFDVIFYEGEFVGNLPLKERKNILSKLCVKPPFYLVKWHLLKDVRQDLIEMVRKGHEGIVVKNFLSFYKLGQDGPMPTPDWRKIKPGR